MAESKRKQWVITSVGFIVEESKMLKWLARELGEKKNAILRRLVRDEYAKYQKE